MIAPHIPILRQGQVYKSLDTQTVNKLGSDEPAAEISFACADMIKYDIQNMGSAREALKKFSGEELVEITKKAGELFLNGDLPIGTEGELQSPEDYVFSLAATSGLPHSLIRFNMRRLGGLFGQIDDIFKGLSRGLEWSVLDRGYGEQGGAPVSFSPTTNELAVILPSNSPAVNALWIPAIAMKVPVLLKPGREEPWTPWRIIQAFIKAGCPPEAFSLYPTQHDGSGAIIRRAGRVMLFGDDSTVKQYENDERVEVHGTGYSKFVIGEDEIENWESYIDSMVESVSANSGRSCICTSTIVVPKYGDEIAHALSKKLCEIKPLPQDDPEAKLSGFANPKFAEWIDEAVEEGLQSDGARDITADYRDGARFVERDGMNYLQPTIVRVDSFDEDLALREFLFPFASVVECPQSDVVEKTGYSLVMTAVTKDVEWINELFDHPEIERLNIGNVPTNRISWNQPHEGNLFDFLYTRRSFAFAESA
ncbi:MAG: aldehyde dehydrogenase [Verrucomicrobiales bacterium]|nr:aldehyde dehydrogenase [Verrucomicrobiales bacterium]|tara:strand:+ start:38346 stop:39785 length:1440 start_codon:yes stop_codon:yes gene_type:complete